MNKFFIIITFLFSFIICSFPSYGEWKYFTSGGIYGEGASDKNGMFRIYFDNKKIRKAGGFIHFRSLYEFTKEDKNCSKSKIYYNKIDCKLKRFKRTKVQFFKLSKRACVIGKSLDLERTEHGKWKNTKPNTIKREISDMICEGTKQVKKNYKMPNTLQKDILDEMCKFDVTCKK